MRGQASRGVWQPIRAPTAPTPARREKGSGCGGCNSTAGNGVVGGVVNGVGSASSKAKSSRGGGVGCSSSSSIGGCGGGARDGGGDTRSRKGQHKFQLAADHVTAAAVAGDGLSDSESEDDEDDKPMPTPADARTAFDDTTTAGCRTISGEAGGAAASRSSSEATKLLSTDSGGSIVQADGGGRSGRGKQFARDGAMEALEDTRRTKRISDAERLADRMGAIGAEVRKCGSSGGPPIGGSGKGRSPLALGAGCTIEMAPYSRNVAGNTVQSLRRLAK